jgi:hypothetical protein
MRISTDTHTIERNEIAHEGKFKIRSSARAFSILSSNLYTNKIKAVIRELSCNAIDSHVAAGKLNIPFDVHLPNSLEPWFSVTDYGLGLSREQTMDLYTTYFASTKSDSNDYIGALGLGSKSPFAYTTTFDVISNFNGECHSFCMFIDEAGEPSVASMGSVSTTACNGVTVKIPVKSSDFSIFATYAGEVFKWFTHKPVVSGNAYYTEKTQTVTLSGDGWRLLEPENYYGYVNAFALMGNVAYPINADNINQRFSNIARQPFVVDFNIGELDVAASRETLSYDPITVKVIEQRLQEIYTDLVGRVDKEFADCATMWDARIKLLELNRVNSTRNILHMLRNSGVKHKYNGVEFSSDTQITWTNLFDKTDQNKARVFTFGGDRLKSVVAFDVDPDTVFVRKDVVDTTSRIRQYVQTNNDKNRYVVIECSDEDNFKKIIAHIGDPPFVLASSLPKAPKKIMMFKGFEFTGKQIRRWGERSRKSDNWNPETQLKTDMTAFYVTIDGMTPVKSTGEEIKRFNEIVDACREIGFITTDEKIWGINKTNTKHIVNKDSWTEFYDYVKNKLNTFIDENNIDELINQKTTLVSIEGKFCTKSEDWVKAFGNMDNSLGDFVKEWVKISQQNKVDIDAVQELLQLFNRVIAIDNKKLKIYELYEKMIQDYPLLSRCRHDNSSKLKEWKPYVIAIDNCKALAS